MSKLSSNPRPPDNTKNSITGAQNSSPAPSSKKPVFDKNANTSPVENISATPSTANKAQSENSNFAQVSKQMTQAFGNSFAAATTASLSDGANADNVGIMGAALKAQATSSSMPSREALGAMDVPSTSEMTASLQKGVENRVSEKLSSVSVFGKKLDSDDSKFAVGAISAIGEAAGLGEASTITNVMGALAGDKQAQFNVGGKVLESLTGGVVSGNFVSTAGAALQGDKKAQASLAMDMTGKLFNDSPVAEGVMGDVLALGGLSGGNKTGAALSLLSKGTEGLMKLTGATENSALGGIARQITGISNVFAITQDLKNLRHAYKNSMVGKSRIERIRSRRDPLLSFEWYAEMPVFGSAGMNIKDEVFSFHVEDVTVTEPVFQVKDFYRLNKRYILPSVRDNGSITITFYEDNALNTKKYLKAWQDSYCNPRTKTYRLDGSTLRNFKLFLLDAKNTIIGTLTVGGAFPLNIGNLNLTSGSSDRITYQIEFGINTMSWDFTQVTEKQRKNAAMVDGFVGKLFG